MNLLDRSLAVVAPIWAERRVAARARLVRARAFFDGATRGRRMSGWRTTSTGPNSEIRGNLGILRDRCRDLERNNPWAKRGVSAIADDAVGYGISYAITHPSTAAQNRLRDLAKKHLDTPAIDADGVHNLAGLQYQVLRAIVLSGEVLIRRRRRRASQGYPLPYQLQIMEPDHLDSNKDGPTDNNGRIVQGVEMNPEGKRIAYWLHQDHPGDGFYSRRTESRRIGAEDVLHVFWHDRKGQVRGVPWLTPCVVTLKDLASYQDAQLVKQQIAAAFAVFETSPEQATDVNATTQDLEFLESGAYEKLPPGHDIRFPDMPSVGDYDAHSRVELRKIAAGLGVPYERLTGDLAQVSFISGRLGMLPYYNSLDCWLWHMLIPLFCEATMRWFLEEAELFVPGAMRAETVWTPPPRPMLDPTNEIPAKQAAIAAGLTTHSEELRALGWDPMKFREEAEKDLEWLRKMGFPAYAAPVPPKPPAEVQDEPRSRRAA